MANRHLRASGNWNGAVWAELPYGAPGSAPTPTAQDHVFIESNYTVSLTADAECGGLFHANGTLSLSHYRLSIKGSAEGGSGVFDSYGSTARRIDLGAGILDIDAHAEGSRFSLSGLNLAFDAGISLVKIRNASFYRHSDNEGINTLSKTFNDFIIELGYDAHGANWQITGSPTFRSLVIRSKNSAAHTVNFNGQVTTDKFVAIGSSASNRLTLHADTFQNILVNDSSYGQFVNADQVGGVAANANSKTYLGSNSIQDVISNEWLLQDPPKISTLKDPLTTAPGSNPNWAVKGTVSRIASGKEGGGYSFAQGSEIVSAGTYDAIGSEFIFERTPQPKNNGSRFGIDGIGGLTNGPKNVGLWWWGQHHWEPYSEVQYWSSYENGGGGNGTAFEYPITASKYLKIAVSESGAVTWSASDGESWTPVHTEQLSDIDMLMLRSARIRGNFGATSIGSINPSLGPQAPTARFTTDVTSGYAPLTVKFTDTSTGIPTSWLWNFGDGTTSTAKNPTKTYTSAGTYTVKLTSTNSIGSTTETKTGHITVTVKKYEIDIVDTTSASTRLSDIREVSRLNISDNITAHTQVVYSPTFQPLPQKYYEYRVYDDHWNYLGVLDVSSEFGYSQRINEVASELKLFVPRNPEARKVFYDYLLDHKGEQILDHLNQPILVASETSNPVGPGTDIQRNFNVDVYAFYGGYDALLDHNEDPILDENGEAILMQYGAPNGRRVYSGYIAKYSLKFGKTSGVNVTLTPHATSTQHYIFKQGANTTVKYLNTDPVQMARNAIANYGAQGGLVKWSQVTMPLSGVQVDYDFNLQTTREAIDVSINLLPSGWYHFFNPADNHLYIQEKSDVPHHTFYYEKHIQEMEIGESIMSLINEVYFSGGKVSEIENPDGTTTDVNLFKHYKDITSATSIRPGLERLSDSRVIKEDSAEVMAMSKIEENKQPRWETVVTISDAVYDIESIEQGQTIGLRNFGIDAIDNLKLQIVAISRAKHTVTLDLDTQRTTTAKRLETLRRQIENEQIRNIPTSPQ